jgi:hypothetical protein
MHHACFMPCTVRSKPVLLAILLVAIHVDTGNSAETLSRLEKMQTGVKILGVCFLVLALAALFQMYRSLSGGLTGFRFIASKFLTVKFMVMLVTVQKFVVFIVCGEFPGHDPRKVGSRAERYFYMLLLVEAPFYAALFAYFFAAPSSAARGGREAAWAATAGSVRRVSADAESPFVKGGGGLVRPGTVSGALCDVLRLHEVIPMHAPVAEGLGEAESPPASPGPTPRVFNIESMAPLRPSYAGAMPPPPPPGVELQNRN